MCEKSTWKVLIKQDVSVIEQTLLLSFSRHSQRQNAYTFSPTLNSGGKRRRTSRRWQFCWPLPRSSWGSPGQMRGQPAVPLPLGRGRSPRGWNSTKRAGRQSARCHWQLTSSWWRLHWWLENCSSIKSVWRMVPMVKPYKPGLRQDPWWWNVHFFPRWQQR